MSGTTPSWFAQYAGKQLTRRRFVGTTAAGVGAALLVACGGSSGSNGLKFDDAATARQPGTVWRSENDWRLADETNEAVKGGIYRSFMTADQTGSYDAMTTDPASVPFSQHVHEFLMARNRGPGIDPKSREAGLPVPMLAESMELSPDGTTVTFAMRQGVKWHPVAPVNGRTMDIDDWKTSTERFLASSPQRVAISEIMSKVEYPDARHMVWKFNFPYAPIFARVWSERFTGPIMPKELNANPQLAEVTPIGTGYKILDNHQRAVTMEYRKHAEYWGGEPFIDRWHAPIIPEYANRYANFVNGNIMDFTPTARDVLLLAKDAPQTVIVASEIPDDRIVRIRFGRNNQKTLPWKDVRVRIALRRAMNMKGIGEFLANKAEFEAQGIPVEVAPMTHLTRNLAYWLDPERGELGALSANYMYEVAEARKLTTAAGFTSPIDIEYHVLPSGDGVVPEQEQLVIDSLQQSGLFNVTIVRAPNATARRNCSSLGQCDGLVQSGTSEDADHIIYRDYHSAGNTSGEQAYPDTRIDRVAEAQRRELDPDKRIEYLKEFQMVAAELMPTIPYIHQYTEFRFRWPWLRNANYGYPDGIGIPTGKPVWGGHRQWLDAEMPNRDRRI